MSVAAALELEGDTIRAARLALGGVAHKPWRVPAAETRLVGKPVGEDTFRLAVGPLLQGAQPREYNAFKVKMAERAIVRALQLAADAA